MQCVCAYPHAYVHMYNVTTASMNESSLVVAIAHAKFVPATSPLMLLQPLRNRGLQDVC